jgi:putative hydrolase of the HAD superfamily
MKYKVILFDADGVTLIEGKLFSEILAEKGLITSLEKTTSFFTGVFKEECLVGKADLKEELAKVIGDWGWKGTVDEIINFWFSIGIDLNSEVVDYITKLRKQGVVCYMTTDQEKYRGALLRNKFGELFDGVFISSEIGYRKKDPEYFQYVYEKVQDKVNDKSEILFFDDGENNVKNAKEFGIEAIHFQNAEDLPKLGF